MSGKEQWVISRMRYMAICRGKATTLSLRPDPDERPLELPDVVLDHGGKKEGDVRGKRNLVGLRLPVQDRESRLQVRRLNVRHESPLEAGLDPLLEIGDLLRELVAGHDDLLPGGVQVIEGMKKLLLRALLSRDELDVVDQKHVDVSVLLLEVAHPVCAQAEDELVREFFRGYVGNPDA